jgi:hypothetical protein
MHVQGTLQAPPHAPQRAARRIYKSLAGWQGLVVLGLLGMTLGLLGCSSDVGGSGQCGGSNNSDACLQITQIVPVYLGQASSNVDAQQDMCTTATTAVPEPFTDHSATVTILNAPLPGVGPTAVTSVTLQDFSVSYTLNSCPATSVGCPPLDTLVVVPGQTITIAARGSADITLPFVPLAKKLEYVNKGGSLTAFPSYTATYIIAGTDAFDNAVSVRGSAQFTIGDFNNCP